MNKSITEANKIDESYLTRLFSCLIDNSLPEFRIIYSILNNE